MGASVTWGTAIGSIAGGLIGGKLPKWRGVKGGWLKNALGEIGFNSARGAITGSVSEGISATVDGENIGNGIAKDTRNGAIGGASQSIAMIATFGTTYKPTDDQLKYANQMAKAFNMSTDNVSWRKGGIYQLLQPLWSKGEKRPVTWGNNVAVFDDTSARTFGHEFGHIIQVRNQGWAMFQAKGIYEQIQYSIYLWGIGKKNPYNLPNNNESGAEDLLRNFGY